MLTELCRKFGWRSIGGLILFWLWIGWVGGAAVLLLFAAPVEQKFRDAGMLQDTINRILFAVTAGWVALSGGAAYFAERTLPLTRKVRVGAHASGAILSCITFVVFLQAGSGVFASFRGGTEQWGERFHFGPYPDADAVNRLRAEGYTGIITLMSPLVPFEAVLLEEERKNAAAAGIELIEASMLPWVSSNEEPLARIRALAEQPTGRYYVHCYLGKNRAQLARFVIMEAGGISSEPADGRSARLARGILHYVGDTIALGPMPTKDDWFGYIIRSGTRRVISLFDPADEDEARRIKEIEELAATSGIRVKAIPVRSESEVPKVVEEVWSSPDRVYIHGYQTDERAIWISKALDPTGTRIYCPADHFEENDPVKLLVPAGRRVPGGAEMPEKLERGAVVRVGDRIYLGPLPTPDEWSTFIAPSNIVRVVSLLNPDDEADAPWIEQEKARASELGVELVCFPLRHKSDAGVSRRLPGENIQGATYIHGFLTDSRVGWVRAVLESKASMPSRFERGEITNLPRNVYLGPLPTRAEWSLHIVPSGIDRIVSLLDPALPNENIALSEVRYEAALAGIDVVTIPVKSAADAAAVAEAVAAGGGKTYVQSYRIDERLAWVSSAIAAAHGI